MNVSSFINLYIYKQRPLRVCVPGTVLGVGNPEFLKKIDTHSLHPHETQSIEGDIDNEMKG